MSDSRSSRLHDGSLLTEMACPPNEGLENLLEFETLISDTSAALLSAPRERIDLAVEHALERVRTFFEADRCVLLSVSGDQQAVNVRVASHAEGVSRMAEHVDFAARFPWSSHRLLVERVPSTSAGRRH